MIACLAPTNSRAMKLARCDALQRWLAPPPHSPPPNTRTMKHSSYGGPESNFGTADSTSAQGGKQKLQPDFSARRRKWLQRGQYSGGAGATDGGGRSLPFQAVPQSAFLSRNRRTRPILSRVASPTCKAQVERGGEFDKRVLRAPQSCFLFRCSSRASLLE